MCNYMQQINKLTQPFLEVLALVILEKGSVYLWMPNQTQEILHDLTEAFMDI